MFLHDRGNYMLVTKTFLRLIVQRSAFNVFFCKAWSSSNVIVVLPFLIKVFAGWLHAFIVFCYIRLWSVIHVWLINYILQSFLSVDWQTASRACFAMWRNAASYTSDTSVGMWSRSRRLGLETVSRRTNVSASSRTVLNVSVSSRSRTFASRGLLVKCGK